MDPRNSDIDHLNPQQIQSAYFPSKNYENPLHVALLIKKTEPKTSVSKENEYKVKIGSNY